MCAWAGSLCPARIHWTWQTRTQPSQGCHSSRGEYQTRNHCFLALSSTQTQGLLNSANDIQTESVPCSPPMPVKHPWSNTRKNMVTQSFPGTEHLLEAADYMTWQTRRQCAAGITKKPAYRDRRSEQRGIWSLRPHHLSQRLSELLTPFTGDSSGWKSCGMRRASR